MRSIIPTRDTNRAKCLVWAAMIAAAMVVFGPAYAQTRGGPGPSPPGAAVYFIGIKNGDTLPTKPTIHFGLRNMSVAPAGIDRPNTGHHHLIIDAPLPPLDKPIPNDFNHLHFGAGQTEAQVTLTPGKHTLQLLLGDKDHIPHTPPVFSERITVNVVVPSVMTAVAGRRLPKAKVPARLSCCARKTCATATRPLPKVDRPWPVCRSQGSTCRVGPENFTPSLSQSRTSRAFSYDSHDREC